MFTVEEVVSLYRQAFQPEMIQIEALRPGCAMYIIGYAVVAETQVIEAESPGTRGGSGPVRFDSALARLDDKKTRVCKYKRLECKSVRGEVECLCDKTR